jgi:hypothetical protein
LYNERTRYRIVSDSFFLCPPALSARPLLTCTLFGSRPSPLFLVRRPSRPQSFCYKSRAPIHVVATRRRWTNGTALVPGWLLLRCWMYVQYALYSKESFPQLGPFVATLFQDQYQTVETVQPKRSVFSQKRR